MDRIDDLTADCFNFLIQLRRLGSGPTPSPEGVHQRLGALIETMRRRAQDAGIHPDDTDEIAYPIIALADEIAIAGPLRQYWMGRPLQLQYFGENIAGENFFTRLEALRAEGRRFEVLKVYYLCLALGFQGRYRVRGGEVELSAVTDALAQDLARQHMLGGEVLSPHGERPSEAATRARADLPVVGLSLGALGLAAVLYIALRISLSSQVASVLQRIAALLQS
jgi:type VI secretion system protein ImpK